MRVWLLALAWLLAACARATPSDTPGMSDVPATPLPATVQVELMIFSGRPNPTWQLAEPEQAIFLDHLAALAEADPEPLVEGLGYQGFRVEVAASTQVPRRHIQLREGQVRIEQAGEVRFYRDPQRALERWLLETGAEEIEPALYEMVLEQLD